MKKCSICEEEKGLEHFQGNGYQPNGKKKYKPNCSPCTNRIRLDDKLEKLYVILSWTNRSLSCELCGYKKNSAALHFHHMDPEEKEFSISQIRSSVSYEKLKKEVEKCVILCANCHAEEHNPHLEIVVDKD